MGMFNYVKINEDNVCNFCGNNLGEDGKTFQTKEMLNEGDDPYCNGGLTCRVVDLQDVKEYYADCRHCLMWNEWKRIDKNVFEFVNNKHYNH